MKYLLWVAIALFAYLLIIPIVYGQDQSEKIEMRSFTRIFTCAKDFNFAHKNMAEIYNRHIVWEGVTLNGTMLVKLYMNKQDSTWTMFEVYPDGSSCAATGGNESMLRESGING